jgi:hypothetical protein
MPNHRQALGTSSTKQRRQVANQFKVRLTTRDQRRVHRQVLRGGIMTGIGTSFSPRRSISWGGAAPGQPSRAAGHLAAPAHA